MSKLGLRAVRLAAQAIGERETQGENWSPRIRSWLAHVGITYPAPYCVAFVSAFIHRAAKEMGINTEWPARDTSDGTKKGAGYSSSALVRWGIASNRILHAPVDGCVGVLRGGPTGFKHTFFVEKVLKDGRLQTVEGNTNPTGSSEGDGVWRLKRKNRNMVFLRI